MKITSRIIRYALFQIGFCFFRITKNNVSQLGGIEKSIVSQRAEFVLFHQIQIPLYRMLGVLTHKRTLRHLVKSVGRTKKSGRPVIPCRVITIDFIKLIG